MLVESSPLACFCSVTLPFVPPPTGRTCTEENATLQERTAPHVEYPNILTSFSFHKSYIVNTRTLENLRKRSAVIAFTKVRPDDVTVVILIC